LTVQLNAGRVIDDSLINSGGCSGDRELKAICQDIAPRLQNGLSLTTALGPYRRRFPEIVRCLIEVGEVSGGIADSAERLAAMFKQKLDSEYSFKYYVYNPFMCLIILSLLDLIYNICQQLSSTAQSLPLFQIAELTAKNVAVFVLEAISLYLCLRVLLRQIYRWYTLRLLVDTIKLALPRVGLISRNLSAARWARSFAVLWSAGINISTALEVSAGSALNAHYERELRKAAAETRQGSSLTESLARTQLLPRNLLAVIRTSEITGRLDNQLILFAGEMERSAYERALVEMNRAVVAVQMLIFALAIIYIFSHLTL
jgi:type II secretory pathway component PulF